MISVFMVIFMIVMVLFCVFLFRNNKKLKKELTIARNLSDKHLALYLLMNHWIRQKNNGRHISNYLIERGYNDIAIYGFNYIGETLYEELKKSDIRVKYAIDQNADHIFTDLKMHKPDDTYEEVDAVVVTAITYFSSIESRLITSFKCPILSLEDILYDLK